MILYLIGGIVFLCAGGLGYGKIALIGILAFVLGMYLVNKDVKK